MPTWVKSSGQWKRVTAPKGRVSGSWRDGKWWVRAGGSWRNASDAEEHSTTLTIGTRNTGYYGPFYTPFNMHERGYDSRGSAFGSMGSTVYSDNGGTSRQIVAAYWTDLAITVNDFTTLVLAGNVPNNDDTFKSIEIGSDTYLRVNGSYSFDGVNSSWVWVDSSPPIGASGTVAFKVKFV